MSCIIDSNRTVTFLDCSDSGLSVSGNVISVLTFFVAAVATYLAFFWDIRDIPQSADAYSNDIRSLHDQLWTIGDIHSQLAKLIANNESGLRISDVHLQSRLQQGQSESLKEARQFLDDYSASYEEVFTNYFKRHRWAVRLKWLYLQRKVEHFRTEASELRSALTLDLLAITLKYVRQLLPDPRKANSGSEVLAHLMLSMTDSYPHSMNIALQQSLHQRDIQAEKLSRRLEVLLSGNGTKEFDFTQKDEQWTKPDSPSPSVMMDPTDLNPPTFLVSPPEDETERSRSSGRSPSPLSTRPRFNRSMSD
jgi:hypothetical protein